jgi:RNA polymerase sigma-70 factor, ECF subfamily
MALSFALPADTASSTRAEPAEYMAESPSFLPDASLEGMEVPTDVIGVHARYGDFVWASLQRLGARGPDLEDLFQEVFVVVHRRLSSFEGRARLSTWLFGICMRLVSAHRRQGRARLEHPVEHPPEHADSAERMPDANLARRQAAERLAAILDDMALEKRAVFVMSVVEEIPSEEIALLLNVPVGTVYSRLNAARKQFAEILERHERRDSHRGSR